jgi:hypothetical protein
MFWVGLEPTIPTSERAKTVHALDRSATVTGKVKYGRKYSVRKRTGEKEFWLNTRLLEANMVVQIHAEGNAQSKSLRNNWT